MEPSPMSESEFDKLIHENQGIIWQICRTFCRNQEDRKDLFQDVVLKLWNGNSSFKNQSKVSTWIYRVGLNHAIDWSRKNKTPGVEMSESIINTKIQDATEPSQYDVEGLYLAINQLKPVERAMVLMHLEQESYKVIADVIGISTKNVSVRLVRIKEKLKKLYKQATQIKQPQHG